MTSREPAIEQTRLYALVDGMVQGVGFRMYVLSHARAIGITGWVRNKPDGKVEVTAEGSYEQLERLVDLLRSGPRSSFVETVLKEWQPATREFRGFEVRRTE